MEDKLKRKELLRAYKAQLPTGGVFAVRHLPSGRLLLQASQEMQGSKNRFDFSVNTGSCVFGRLQKDWRADGPGAFRFEVLEELKQGEAQTQQEFAADVAALLDIWRERLQAEGALLY